ncbi:glycosyltransferase family 2 protein [Lactobacillus sp. PSON]|uniref:glycosyltransferase family 2 protein n=1 Tax=Lactobacillus sp. PSON TaxID=3455454 RepID=UPI00404384A2
MKDISIIIPVYNREKYIKECIDSIMVSQTKNMEIIIVDDGSTDKTSEICDNLQRKSNNIKVIHQKNMGVAAARNTGLKAAKGNWIAWIDSDDIVSSNYVNILNNIINQGEYDLIIFGYESFTKKRNPKYNNKILQLEPISKEKCFEKLGSISFGNFLWNKIFKKELFKNITFPDGKVYEDIATTYKLINVANKIGILPLKIYFYRQHNNSIIHQMNTIKGLRMLKNRVEFQKELVAFLKDKYLKAYEIENKLLTILAFEYIKAEEKCRIPNSLTYNECKNIIKDYRISLKRDGIKLSTKVVICNIAFPIYQFIIKLHG